MNNPDVKTLLRANIVTTLTKTSTTDDVTNIKNAITNLYKTVQALVNISTALAKSDKINEITNITTLAISAANIIVNLYGTAQALLT